MGKTYKNLIFTDHAYHRAQQRSIQMHAIYQTVKHPDFSKKLGESKEKFFKTINQRNHQVVAIYKPDQKKYLVISTWVRGENDKLPLAWQLIILPFKLFWLLIKSLFKILKKLW